MGSWPIPYMGMRVGGRINGTEKWKGTLEKVRRILNSWEASSISMGRRLTLIKSMLSAIPLYNLSISRLPRGVEKQWNSLFSYFCGGVKEGEKKLVWVG